jgi:uncharacterized caspase-like protein
MAEDGKRVALVIGNGGYEHAPPLRNPRNDAAGIGGKLAGLGFEVISGLDLGRDAMEDKLFEFEAAIGGDAVLCGPRPANEGAQLSRAGRCED